MIQPAGISSIKRNLNPQKLENLAEIFNCIGDPTCLRLIKALILAQKLCVSDLAKIAGVSVSAVSHQMRKLKILGLVESERMGQMICYQLKDGEIPMILKEVLE